MPGRQRARRAQGHRHRSGASTSDLQAEASNCRMMVLQPRRDKRGSTMSQRTMGLHRPRVFCGRLPACRRHGRPRVRGDAARRASGSGRGSRDIERAMRRSALASLLREKYLRELSPLERPLETYRGWSGSARMIEQSGNWMLAYRVVLLAMLLAIAGAVGGWVFTQHARRLLVAPRSSAHFRSMKVSRDARATPRRSSRSSCPRRWTS